MEIVLRRGKLLAGGRLYRAGEPIPDGAEARELLSRGDAEAAAPPAPAPSPMGPYEGRTVRELQALLKERGLEPPKGATKADLVEALTGGDAGGEIEEDDGPGDP